MPPFYLVFSVIRGTTPPSPAQTTLVQTNPCALGSDTPIPFIKVALPSIIIYYLYTCSIKLPHTCIHLSLLSFVSLLFYSSLFYILSVFRYNMQEKFNIFFFSNFPNIFISNFLFITVITWIVLLYTSSERPHQLILENNRFE